MAAGLDGQPGHRQAMRRRRRLDRPPQGRRDVTDGQRHIPWVVGDRVPTTGVQLG
jgi:hypothetical protein